MVDLEDKNRSETPPPSYDEALQINSQTTVNPQQPTDGATSMYNLFIKTANSVSESIVFGKKRARIFK